MTDDGKTYWYCCSVCKKPVFPDLCTEHLDAPFFIADGNNYWNLEVEENAKR